MLTVIETPVFIRYAEKIWNEDERVFFIQWLAEHPDAGEVIPATGGLRKVRWSRSGMGKRGGTRVIYLLRIAQGELALLMIYTKAEHDNLSAEFLNRLAKVIQE